MNDLKTQGAAIWTDLKAWADTHSFELVIYGAFTALGLFIGWLAFA